MYRCFVIFLRNLELRRCWVMQAMTLRRKQPQAMWCTEQETRKTADIDKCRLREKYHAVSLEKFLPDVVIPLIQESK